MPPEGAAFARVASLAVAVRFVAALGRVLSFAVVFRVVFLAAGAEACSFRGGTGVAVFAAPALVAAAFFFAAVLFPVRTAAVAGPLGAGHRSSQ
ncbi:hypothetical protein [Kitasatospora sp. NPDC087271]|uniref:hypothetical protein n=1 Tax=Kitasatospora sp. NPDC087271 TaxID=3364067 RepID=UPI00382686A2